MLVVGFARPTRPRRVPREQATVILAIDVSLSMEASDVAPSRLVAAQQAARSFVEQLPARFRVGLISFDGTARVLVGPTEDHTAVSQGIDALQLGPRTAAGEAVFTALETIASSVQGTVGTPPPARIVLMSDGATTSGRSIDDAAAAAKQAGVPVSTIAFGTDSGSVTVSGRDVPVPVDRVAMKALADESGGRFFEAASGDQLRSVYRDIGSSIGYRTVRQENTATFTGFALVLVAAGVVAGLVWTGRVL
jgi:Ca-activated chloride channel family protein